MREKINRERLLNKIIKAAQKDEKYRGDLRYRKTMAFLVKKGFLKTNIDFRKNYHTKLAVKDALWAGQNVEPRILEVLPAAIARLPKFFVFDGTEETTLHLIVKELLDKKEEGTDFHNIPYKKIRVWMDLPLSDRRTKTNLERKVMKTFRLSPSTIKKMGHIKFKLGLSEAEIIEKLVAGAGFEPTTFGL